MVRWVGWIAENQLKILLVWVVAECFKVVTVGSALLEETCCFEVKENLKITHVLLACRPVGIPRGRFKHRTRSRRDRNHELYALAAGRSHYDELIAARSVYRWHRCVRFKLTLCRHRNHEVHALAAGGSHYDELLAARSVYRCVRFKLRIRSDRNHELYASVAAGSHYDELLAARSFYRWHRCVRFKLTICRDRNHEVYAVAAGWSQKDRRQRKHSIIFHFLWIVRGASTCWQTSNSGEAALSVTSNSGEAALSVISNRGGAALSVASNSGEAALSVTSKQMCEVQA